MAVPGTVVPVRGDHSTTSTTCFELSTQLRQTCTNCSNLWSRLAQLRKNCQMCDVKIFLDDGSIFNVHSVVLACRSEIFIHIS